MKFEQSTSEKNESRKRLLKVILTGLERTSKSLPSRSVGKYTQCQSSLKFPPPYFGNKIQDTLAPTPPCFFCGFQTVNLLQAEDHQVLLFWEMLKLKDIIASGHSENRVGNFNGPRWHPPAVNLLNCMKQLDKCAQKYRSPGSYSNSTPSAAFFVGLAKSTKFSSSTLPPHLPSPSNLYY